MSDMQQLREKLVSKGSIAAVSADDGLYECCTITIDEAEQVVALIDAFSGRDPEALEELLEAAHEMVTHHTTISATREELRLLVELYARFENALRDFAPDLFTTEDD